MKIAISDVKEVDLERIADSDAILIGAPNHMGRPARTIREFMDKLGKLDLKAKWVAVFDTYLGGDLEGREGNGEENRRKGSQPEANNFWPINKGSRGEGPNHRWRAPQMQRFRKENSNST